MTFVGASVAVSATAKIVFFVLLDLDFQVHQVSQ